MISFACKAVDLKDLVMCSFGLTKGEYKLLVYLMDKKEEKTIIELAKITKVDRSTAQKNIGGLLQKKLVLRRQMNQETGGYSYYYHVIGKKVIKDKITKIMESWTENVVESIREW